MKCSLLIPDTHRPFHNKKAYGLMMNVAADISPSEVIILGDYADMYNASRYEKDPRVFQELIDEIADVNAGLDEIDKTFKNAKKKYVEGNHEFRFEKYLTEKAPALFGLTSIEHLLNINRRPNWTWVGYGPNQFTQVQNSKLYVRHEPLGSSAKATAARALCSLAYGHIHRIEESHLVGLDGTNHVCFSVGWLGDSRKSEVFSYVKGHHQWQLGFGLVWVDPANGYFYHQKVHILDNMTCVVNGKKYKA